MLSEVFFEIAVCLKAVFCIFFFFFCSLLVINQSYHFGEQLCLLASYVNNPCHKLFINSGGGGLQGWAEIGVYGPHIVKDHSLLNFL